MIKNCTNCEDHIVLPDPDPHDWFCDDDVKVLCKITKKNITAACRPYNIKKECNTPKWCPKNMKYTEIAVMADFSSSGIWRVIEGRTGGMIDFENLGVPNDLQKEFDEWIEFYDDKCHARPDYKFKKEMADELNKRGRILTGKLKKLYPTIKVYYRGEIEGDMLPLEEITGV